MLLCLHVSVLILTLVTIQTLLFSMKLKVIVLLGIAVVLFGVLVVLYISCCHDNFTTIKIVS